MKWIISAICAVGLAVSLIIGGLTMTRPQEVEYLRIHVRANSNSEADQAVKYMVKDGIVALLTELLVDAESKTEATEIITDNFSLIEEAANMILSKEGFSYTSRAEIKNEYFPTRTYSSAEGEITLAEGSYDALILNLGSGTGNNWWCIVYPAFCFGTSKNFDKIVYISQIWEILNSRKQGG